MPAARAARIWTPFGSAGSKCSTSRIRWMRCCRWVWSISRGTSWSASIRPSLDLAEVGEAAEAEEAAQEALEADSFAALLERVKATLGGRVSDVREGKTLVGSPARLVSEDESANRYMFRINRLLDQDYELPVKAMELNPRHPLMHNLSGMIAAGGADELIEAVAEQIFETALLQDGIHPDPSSMAERLTLLMQAATGSAGADLDFAGAKTVISEPAVEEMPQIDLGDLDVGDAEFEPVEGDEDDKPTPP